MARIKWLFVQVGKGLVEARRFSTIVSDLKINAATGALSKLDESASFTSSFSINCESSKAKLSPKDQLIRLRRASFDRK